MVSASPSLIFHTKLTISDLENKCVFCPNRDQLGPPVSEFLTRFSKFYDPTDSEHKFHKTEIENSLYIEFELVSPWLGIHSHNHYTTFNL